MQGKWVSRFDKWPTFERSQMSLQGPNSRLENMLLSVKIFIVEVWIILYEP